MYEEVEYFCQDDKAKIIVGNAVIVSTGVQANNTGIFHGFHVSNTTLSVALCCVILKNTSDSFCIGDDRDRCSQMFVILRHSVYDPS